MSLSDLTKFSKFPAFKWRTICWAGMKFKAFRDHYLSLGHFGPPRLLNWPKSPHRLVLKLHFKKRRKRLFFIRRGSVIFFKSTFLKSVHSKEKDEACLGFLVKNFTKSVHRGEVIYQVPKLQKYSRSYRCWQAELFFPLKASQF